MTREEAINRLNLALNNNMIEDVQSAYDYIMALKMAIEALEQESIFDNIRAKIKEQIDYHDEEHRKYDSEEECGISLGLELALVIVNKEVKATVSGIIEEIETSSVDPEQYKDVFTVRRRVCG